MTEHVFILGAGRAGRSLARALIAAGADVCGLHGRHADTGPPRVTAGRLPATLGDATIVLVTVRDSQLDGALRELADSPLRDGAVVLHASGATDPDALVTLRAQGHPTGTLHPLVPLSDPERAPALLRGAWIGIDGDPEAVRRAEWIATRIDAHALRIPPGEKARYHAAAVFAANFPVVLAAIAERLLAGSGVSAAAARGAVHRLMAAAVLMLRDSPPGTVLTGPLARGDTGSIRRHLDVLAQDPAALDVYLALSRAALPIAAEQGTGEQHLAEIQALLDGVLTQLDARADP